MRELTRPNFEKTSETSRSVTFSLKEREMNQVDRQTTRQTDTITANSNAQQGMDCEKMATLVHST